MRSPSMEARGHRDTHTSLGVETQHIANTLVKEPLARERLVVRDGLYLAR